MIQTVAKTPLWWVNSRFTMYAEWTSMSGHENPIPFSNLKASRQEQGASQHLQTGRKKTSH